MNQKTWLGTSAKSSQAVQCISITNLLLFPAEWNKMGNTPHPFLFTAQGFVLSQ